jgi:hypothetical protein
MPFDEGGSGDEGDVVEVYDLGIGQLESMMGMGWDGLTLRWSSNLGWEMIEC